MHSTTFLLAWPRFTQGATARSVRTARTVPAQVRKSFAVNASPAIPRM
jgi:hypothetical protein